MGRKRYIRTITEKGKERDSPKGERSDGGAWGKRGVEGREDWGYEC